MAILKDFKITFMVVAKKMGPGEEDFATEIFQTGEGINMAIDCVEHLMRKLEDGQSIMILKNSTNMKITWPEKELLPKEAK